MTTPEPVLPDYDGGCVANLVPVLLNPPSVPPVWWPAAGVGDGPVVLLILDGLGWEQLQARAHLAPTLTGFEGGPITTVAPSTTASALTSITTGLAPGEHGIVGYRISVDGEVLNVLGWRTPRGDARSRFSPEKFQPHEPFEAQRPPVVSPAHLGRSGFTSAHLRGARYRGYRVLSSLVLEVEAALRAGEPFVYAYYDGLDKVGHGHGLGAHFDAELRACDQMVADLAAGLPANARLVVSADHGQVETGDRVVEVPAELQALVDHQSGEARFRWLHARPGTQARLLDEATSALGDRGWIRSRDQIVDEGWFGSVSDEVIARLGDVALVATDQWAFHDPADTGHAPLIGRHGSLTSAEMYVPLLCLHR